MSKFNVHILWFFLGVFIIAVFSIALDVGDDSECSEGEIIITNGAIWTCSDGSLIESTEWIVYFNQSPYSQIDYDIQGADASTDAIAPTGVKYIFGGNFE